MDAKLAHQKLSGVAGACQDDWRRMIDPIFQPTEAAVSQAPTPQKAVIDHLAGEAALKIKHHGNVEQLRDRAADERAFVHVRVDHIGPKAQRGDKRRPQQQRIERKLVARRTDLILGAPGRGACANNIQSVHIAAFVIGHDLDLLAGFAQDARFFQDADVPTIVREE